MGRTHCNAFLQAPRFFDVPYQPVLKAVCGAQRRTRQEVRGELGLRVGETDWRALVERKDIDLIDIASPNDTHAEIAIAAARAGKMVMCEKPLGRTAAEAQTMVEAVEAAGVPNMVWYNYRRVPAVTLLKKLIDEGKLGPHLSLPREVPAGLDDLGRSAAGRRRALASGRRRRRQRRHRRPARALHRHGALAERTDRRSHGDDRNLHQGAQAQPDREGASRSASTMPARSCAGSRTDRSRLFEATRYARGHKALYTLEINGEHASARWDLHDLHRLQWFDHRDEGRLRGWRSVHITDGDHPYMKHWWVPGLQIGYEHTFIHQFADFLEGWRRASPRADVPRRPRDRLRDRRGAEVGEESTVGNSVECRRQRDMRDRRSRRLSVRRRSNLLVKSCPVSIVFDNTLAPGRGTVRPK